MAVNADIVGNAVQWLATDCRLELTWWGNKEWFVSRNQWLKNQGIGGIIVNDERTEEIANWFLPTDKFWFVNEAAETLFVLRWS